MKGRNTIKLCTEEMKDAVNLWLSDKFKDPAPTCMTITSEHNYGAPIFTIELNDDTAIKAEG